MGESTACAAQYLHSSWWWDWHRTSSAAWSSWIGLFSQHRAWVCLRPTVKGRGEVTGRAPPSVCAGFFCLKGSNFQVNWPKAQFYYTTTNNEHDILYWLYWTYWGYSGFLDVRHNFNLPVYLSCTNLNQINILLLSCSPCLWRWRRLHSEWGAPHTRSVPSSQPHGGECCAAGGRQRRRGQFRFIYL